jgi:NADP-dependent aldehyde dehydrogenase
MAQSWPKSLKEPYMVDESPGDTGPGDLAVRLEAATAASRPWGALAPSERGSCLRAVADRLDAASEELVPMAAAESHLGTARLVGELGRTTFQLRMFADQLDEGSFLRVSIDRPDPSWPPGPRPDLRRMMIPLGPVVVFAASNFPFAFSVAGGDTASALAAGCPVVLKAHPGHPVLSERVAALVIDGLRSGGAPDGTFCVIYGEDAGRNAVTSEHIKAGAFTGSLDGGRALFDLAASRATPIPFYAEMGSLNPVFVTRSAMADRADQVLEEFTTSFTMSAGQFCTKPGLLFVPAGTTSDQDIAAIVAARGTAAPLLNAHIEQGYRSRLTTLRDHPAVRTIVDGEPADADGDAPGPTLLATTVPALLADRDALLVECFGPTSILVEYADDDELLAAAGAFGGQLAAGVHGVDTDAVLPELLSLLSDRAGRVLWNGWPTGVSVTEAMQHGGPYPATTAPLHTSVGTASIDRFLRPVCYQSMPGPLLPPALRDDNPLGVPRRVNGQRDVG